MGALCLAVASVGRRLMLMGLSASAFAIATVAEVAIGLQL